MADVPEGAIDRHLDVARRRISMIEPAAAAALREKGAVLIDTRPSSQREAHGTIAGAIVIDRNVLEWRIDPTSAHRDTRIDPDRPLVVFCQQGYSSSLAVAALVDIGVRDVHDLRGGFDAWRAAGLPIAGGPVTGMVVEPLTGTIGAEVHGVTLPALSDDTTVAMRDALLRHRVLFVRGQQLTPTQLVTLGRRFGALTPAHPLVGGLDDDHPEVLVLDSRDYALAGRWHTDLTCSSCPPLGAVLAAVEVPERGGDALWADLVDAYATLSRPLRTLIDPLVAVHDAGPTGALDPVRHPVVRVHPETGERALFVNPTFTRHVEGLADGESAGLLALLYAHMTEPERTVRWRWRAGDVAFWDNRATAHYAVADDAGAFRLMHRVTIAGDRTVGPEGSARKSD